MFGRRAGIWLERLLIGISSLALSVGLIALMSGFFTSRDPAGVSGAGAPSASGAHFRSLGDGILRAGGLRPAYNSEPPTSGAHLPAPILRDGGCPDDDQILTALASGDVLFMYGTRRAPAGLRALADAVAGPFTPRLAAAGQVVILGCRPAVTGIVALAWTRLLRVRSASAPSLRAFAQRWLGRAA